MDRIKAYKDFINESKDNSIAKIESYDTTLKDKILGILFQEGANSMDGLIDILKKKTNNKANSADAYNYIKEKVKEFMSDEYSISIDTDKVKDPVELINTMLNMVIDINTREIVKDLN